MEILDILLGAAISGLFAIAGTYVGFRFMVNRLKKGVVTEVLFNLLADIADDVELQHGIANILRIGVAELTKGLGIGRTSGKPPSLFEQIALAVAQKYLGQGQTQQEAEKPKEW